MRNVVSDKTGTLTQDGMTYEWPLRFTAAPVEANSSAGFDLDPRSQWVDPTEPPTPVPGAATATGSEDDDEAVARQQWWTHGAGPLLLLATNDSAPNPQYAPNDDRSSSIKKLVRCEPVSLLAHSSRPN